MADNSGMLVVIRRSDETVIETVSTNDELNILKASGCGLKILVELINLAHSCGIFQGSSQIILLITRSLSNAKRILSEPNILPHIVQLLVKFDPVHMAQ